MNREPKNQWTEALLSDEFQQGKNALTRIVDGVEKDCCLGVLCKLYARTHELHPQVVGKRMYYGIGQNGAYLPDEVAEWAGIRRDQEYVLSDKNDDGVTFAEIAAWIEENL